MDKLKPCPFCGNERKQIVLSETGLYAVVQCIECWASGPRGDTIAEAEAAWNHRPPNEPLTLEQLREMDGEPVYLVKKSDGYRFGYAIICANDKRLLLGGGGSIPFQVIKDEVVIAYRQRPEGNDINVGSKEGSAT